MGHRDSGEVSLLMMSEFLPPWRSQAQSKLFVGPGRQTLFAIIASQWASPRSKVYAHACAFVRASVRECVWLHP